MSIERQFKARTRTASVSTVIGITLVLVMLGCQGFVLLNASALERYFKENVRVELFLKRDLKEVDVMRFRKELDTETFTRETRYVTADEAAEQLKQDLGEDFLGVLGSNPLLPSVELHVNADYAQPDSMKWIVEHLKSDRRVQEVAYNAAVVENIDGNMAKLNLGGFIFLALLLFVAVALINNTIRLAIYSKRFLIRTMHLVGATQWFIKKPFLASGVWQGLVAALLAVGVLTGLLQLGREYVPDLLAFTDVTTLGLLFAVVLAVGLLISLASTWFAVGRYLRMDYEDLHWS
ncbi:MAG TPA: permease-like cell division protein FtsX [Flavobacteriales bacterium]|nr:permease-like cell division protein FtsX [Flavobacteriales bacterium]